MLALGISAQSSFLNTLGYYYAIDLFDGNVMPAFDVYDGMFYGNSGQTIHVYDPVTQAEQESYLNNQGYEGFVSFLSVSADGESIYAGYTTIGNVDDRIYQIDTGTGEWTQVATFPANFDHEILGGHHLVSGLNSTNFGDPNSVFLLDISGNNQHRKIVEIGGYAAGIATDSDGNLYAVTSFYGEQNAVYRWENANVLDVIEDTGAAFLTLDDAMLLCSIPAGGNDCEVDEEGHVIFNFNDFTGDKVMAYWNAISGGDDYTVVATAPDESDWLGNIKALGTINSWAGGNHIFTTSYGRPVAEIYGIDPQGIFNPQKLLRLQVYPNPTTDFIRILNTTETYVPVNLYDLNGRLVKSFEKSTNQTFDIRDLQNGMYILRAGNYQGRIVKK
jgi:hypothetical protein